MLKDLFDRRIPQILGIYLAAGWAVLEFTDYLVNRYVLSAHLGDFALLTWGSMIPTVLMLAYFHGRPGRDEWTTTEKFGIPINLVAAAALLFIVFGGKDLGAATTVVTVEDETGNEVEREVPKSEFRKKLAIFYFDNESGDTAFDWLQYGVAVALGTDLIQDHFLDVRTAVFFFADDLREAGYKEGIGLPLTLRREIAEDQHLDYFVSGKLYKEEGQLAIETSLYETRRGKLLQEHRYSGPDVFELIDEMAIQMKHDLEIPATHIEESTDLPVSELLTSSIPAYRHFVDGVYAFAHEEDWEAADSSLALAVAEDPSYAFAYVMQYAVFTVNNEGQRAQGAIQSAMQHLYKLPERVQFSVKAEYHWLIKQEPEKAIAVAAMHAEFFPEDIQAHARLAAYHQLRNEKDKAIAAIERILELDSTQYNFLRAAGSLYESKGDFEQALNYYQQYADQFPSDHRSFAALGSLNRTLGDHERAQEQYERALAIEPDNVSVLTQLAHIESDLGRFEKAVEKLDEALAASKTPAQRTAAYNALSSFYERRGQLNKAIEYIRLDWAELDKSQPALAALQAKLGDLDTYAKAGQTEFALRTADAIAATINPPFDRIASLGYLWIYSELEDAEKMEEARATFDQFIDALGIEVLRSLSLWAHGRVLELRGECDQAIISYRRALELEPTEEADLNLPIGRCHREIGELQLAEQRLLRVLELEPFNPQAHYELALVYADRGDDEKAAEHLRTALSVWAPADPNFKPAQKARDKLAGLTSSS